VLGSRFLATCVAASALVFGYDVAAQRPTPSVRGYVTVATGYWEHGLSQSEDPSVALGIDYDQPAGFFVGARATSVGFAIEYSYSQPRDVQVNAYAGFHRRRGDWSWTVGLGRYAFPGTAIDYDYTTFDAGVGYRDRLFYSVSWSNEYYRVFGSSLDQQVDVTFPLRGNFELAAGVGRFEISDRPVRIDYYNVGVSKLVGRVALDLRYYGSDYPQLSVLGDPAADPLVLSVSVQLRKRTR